MRYYNLGAGKYLFHFKRKYTKQEMLKIAKVKPHTYAWQFVEEIHHSIFICAKNLMNEYKNYYLLEYDSFEEYLFWRYGIQKNFFDGITNITDDNNLFLIVVENKLEVCEQFEINDSVRTLLSLMDGDT